MTVMLIYAKNMIRRYASISFYEAGIILVRKSDNKKRNERERGKKEGRRGEKEKRRRDGEMQRGRDEGEARERGRKKE